MKIQQKHKVISEEGLAIYALFFETEKIKHTKGLVFRNRGCLEATLLDVILDKEKNSYLLKDVDFRYEYEAKKTIDDFMKELLKTRTSEAWKLMHEVRKLKKEKILDYVPQEETYSLFYN